MLLGKSKGKIGKKRVKAKFVLNVFSLYFTYKYSKYKIVAIAASVYTHEWTLDVKVEKVECYNENRKFDLIEQFPSPDSKIGYFRSKFMIWTTFDFFITARYDGM